MLAQTRLGQLEKANDLLDAVFRDLDPRADENGGKPLRAVLAEHLTRAAASPELESIGDPLTVARMQHILGSTLTGLGNTSEGIELLNRAYKTRETQLGPNHPDTLTTRNNLAVAYITAGRTAEAIAMAEAVVRGGRTLRGGAADATGETRPG